MAKHNPSAEKAGMRKIVEQPPQGDALKIAEILKNLGFNVELLGSENHNFMKLRGLNPDDLRLLREAFIKYNNPGL